MYIIYLSSVIQLTKGYVFVHIAYCWISARADIFRDFHFYLTRTILLLTSASLISNNVPDKVLWDKQDIPELYYHLLDTLDIFICTCNYNINF